MSSSLLTRLNVRMHKFNYTFNPEYGYYLNDQIIPVFSCAFMKNASWELTLWYVFPQVYERDVDMGDPWLSPLQHSNSKASLIHSLGLQQSGGGGDGGVPSICVEQTRWTRFFRCCHLHANGSASSTTTPCCLRPRAVTWSHRVWGSPRGLLQPAALGSNWTVAFVGWSEGRQRTWPDQARRSGLERAGTCWLLALHWKPAGATWCSRRFWEPCYQRDSVCRKQD